MGNNSALNSYEQNAGRKGNHSNFERYRSLDYGTGMMNQTQYNNRSIEMDGKVQPRFLNNSTHNNKKVLKAIKKCNPISYLMNLIRL